MPTTNTGTGDREPISSQPPQHLLVEDGDLPVNGGSQRLEVEDHPLRCQFRRANPVCRVIVRHGAAVIAIPVGLIAEGLMQHPPVRRRAVRVIGNLPGALEKFRRQVLDVRAPIRPASASASSGVECAAPRARPAWPHRSRRHIPAAAPVRRRYRHRRPNSAAAWRMMASASSDRCSALSARAFWICSRAWRGSACRPRCTAASDSRGRPASR